MELSIPHMGALHTSGTATSYRMAHVSAPINNTIPTVTTVPVHESVVSAFLPDGATVTPASERYTIDPESKIPFGHHPDATPAQHAQLKAAVLAVPDAFAFTLDSLRTPYHGQGGKCHITTITDKAVFCRPRPQSQPQKDVTNEKCNEMLSIGIIEPAPRSKYASAPTIPLKKATDGTWTERRFCIDFRQINTLTAPHNTYVPVADQLFQEFGNAKFFPHMDMHSGFF